MDNFPTVVKQNVAKQYCDECGVELHTQLFRTSEQKLCRKCYDIYILGKQSIQGCICNGPTEITICPRCGRARYHSAEEH